VVVDYVSGMIEEYLQEIVENRKDQHYLLDQVCICVHFIYPIYIVHILYFSKQLDVLCMFLYDSLTMKIGNTSP
jgi:hypothetical protein